MSVMRGPGGITPDTDPGAGETQDEGAGTEPAGRTAAQAVPAPNLRPEGAYGEWLQQYAWALEDGNTALAAYYLTWLQAEGEPWALTQAADLGLEHLEHSPEGRGSAAALVRLYIHLGHLYPKTHPFHGSFLERLDTRVRSMTPGEAAATVVQAIERTIDLFRASLEGQEAFAQLQHSLKEVRSASLYIMQQEQERELERLIGESDYSAALELCRTLIEVYQSPLASGLLPTILAHVNARGRQDSPLNRRTAGRHMLEWAWPDRDQAREEEARDAGGAEQPGRGARSYAEPNIPNTPWGRAFIAPPPPTPDEAPREGGWNDSTSGGASVHSEGGAAPPSDSLGPGADGPTSRPRVGELRTDGSAGVRAETSGGGIDSSPVDSRQADSSRMDSKQDDSRRVDSGVGDSSRVDSRQADASLPGGASREKLRVEGGRNALSASRTESPGHLQWLKSVGESTEGPGELPAETPSSQEDAPDGEGFGQTVARLYQAARVEAPAVASPSRGLRYAAALVGMAMLAILLWFLTRASDDPLNLEQASLPAAIQAAAPPESLRPATPTPFPPASGPPGKLSLEIVPSDKLELYLDGRLIPSGQVQRLELPSGRHEVRVFREAHEPYEQVIWTDANTDTRLQIALQRSPQLQIKVSPSDRLEVWIDERRLPSSILSKPVVVPPGKHRLEVRREGYQSHMEEFTAAATATHRFDITLKRVQLRSDPP